MQKVPRGWGTELICWRGVCKSAFCSLSLKSRQQRALMVRLYVCVRDALLSVCLSWAANISLIISGVCHFKAAFATSKRRRERAQGLFMQHTWPRRRTGCLPLSPGHKFQPWTRQLRAAVLMTGGIMHVIARSLVDVAGVVFIIFELIPTRASLKLNKSHSRRRPPARRKTSNCANFCDPTPPPTQTKLFAPCGGWLSQIEPSRWDAHLST